jgi:homeobox protein cut-like
MCTLCVQDSASKVAALESKLANVTSELDEYKEESKELKNQDLTIRKLEDKIRAQQELLEEKDQEIESARAAAAAELEARSADEARIREEMLEKELSRAREAFETMKRHQAATQAQLLAVQEKGDQVVAAAQSESELAMEEVARAEQRLAELTKERDALLEKITVPGDNSATPAHVGHTESSEMNQEIKSLTNELKSQRDFTLKLREELEVTSVSYQKQVSSLETKIHSLQANLEAKESYISALETQLSSRPRPEELQESRQQIRMLKAILQNSAANEDDEKLDDSENSEGLAISSMETALLEKNQKLESSLTLLRMQLAEANDAVGVLNAKIQDIEDQTRKKDALIEELEEHLENATRQPKSPSDDTEAVKPGSVFTGDNKSMIQALSAQRDRLKARVSELEGEISTIRMDLNQARESAKAAREDNIALVERLKYVEGYMSRGVKSTSDIEKGGDSVERYMKEYEKKMNPFTDFRTREKEARRRKLPIHDRAAYALGSAFVSGNRIAKSAIVIYALALHFIAFIVIAGFSHRHSEKMDALETLCHDYNLKHGTNSVVDPVIGGGSLP